MFDHQRAIDAFTYAGIDYLVHVPATGMSPIYNYFEAQNACIYATREEEAVAIACGLAIAGKTPLVFIQQSGVGNLLNAYIGLSEGYDIYFPTLVLDRGIDDENPIQAYSSARTIPILNALGGFRLLDFSAININEQLTLEIKNKKRWFVTKY